MDVPELPPIGGSPKNAQNGLYASASLDDKTGEVILKAVNSGSAAQSVKVSLGSAAAKASAKSLVLAAGDLNDENSLDQPKKIAPVENTISVSGSEAQLSLPAYSMTVLRIPVR